ncbi:MAG: glucokinase [Nitrospiraceae bacterium]|nr:MAG: glucokinase [Nitrospiraceae bacterium]
MSTRKILSADIGGTNSRFGCFETDAAGRLALVGSKWFRTGDADSFTRLITMVNQSDFPLRSSDSDMAVFAVAGPVEKNGVYSAPPLIPWDIDITNARDDYGLRRCALINDFIAQAFATRTPAGKSAQEILPGNIPPDGTVAVIGAGTGLGKAALVPGNAGSYVAVPSEGGHASFPFVSDPEFKFQKFVMRELGEEYLTGNHIVSGKGLSLIHKFLTGEKLEPKEVVTRCTPASETLAWAARFYGRTCRNYALEVLSLGGMYIAGGVAAKLPGMLTHKAFGEEFRSSKTMSRILEQISVFLITNEESGLWGAALLGQQMLKKEGAF